ncbi:MAG: hypothetical protein QOD86_1929 [Miltoncostaeaceae bacterium]|jgi:hypothetical protein|nr:hypothetical protein [Miltoncostaeaceae bacterium]
MVGFGRRMVPVLTLVALATAGVADAAAATRHVAPDGAGTACSAASPCAIEVGVEGAAAGDEVVIAAGGYTAAAGAGEAIVVPGGVTVRGAVIGPGRPIVTTSAFGVGAGSLLSDLEIRGVVATAPLTVASGGRGDRLLVRGAPAAASVACTVTSATLTNSVCLGGEAAGSTGAILIGSGTKLRNVTALSGGYGVDVPTGDAPTLINTIAVGAGGVDLHRESGLFAVSISHSYVPVFTGGPFQAVNRITTGLAVRDAPTDLRQAAGSTTIDAGTPIGVAAGELDLNGNQRFVGAHPDIGAYEQVGPPGADAGTVEATPDAATVRPAVTTAGGRTQVAVAYGTELGIFGSVVTVSAPAANAPGIVDVPLAGLAPFTTYGYRVTVTSDGGITQSAPASFTTPARPASAALAAPSRIGKDRATLAGTVDTGGAPGEVRFEVTAPGGRLTVRTPAQALPAADGPRTVSAQVTELAQGTDHQVVLVLTTPAGTIRSAVETFTTLGTPPTSPPPPAPGTTVDPRTGASPDTRRPRVTVRVPGAVRIGRRGVLVARVTCDEPCTLRADARLGVRGGKPARFRLLPNARITLRLRPVRRTRLVDVDDVRLTLTRARRAALTALRAGRRVVVRIDVQARDAAGNLRRVRTFVAVRR